MKLDNNKLANTFALAMGVLWIICSGLVWLLPGFSFGVANWWMHGMDISMMGGWNLSFSNFVFGGITAVVSAWGVGWILGWAWKTVNKKGVV